jgi:DNA-binding NtrC family response regulator
MDQKNIHVLIVEDSEDDAYLVERVLRRHGFQPVCRRVDNDVEMRQALEEREWDLIISDYLMPSFNALGAMQLYRDQGLDVPFIVVSGSIGEDVAVQAMKSGVHDYLMKDNLARLGATVERELREAANRREKATLQERISTLLREALLTIKNNLEAGLADGDTEAVRRCLQEAHEAATRALSSIDELRPAAGSASHSD